MAAFVFLALLQGDAISTLTPILKHDQTASKIRNCPDLDLRSLSLAMTLFIGGRFTTRYNDKKYHKFLQFLPRSISRSMSFHIERLICLLLLTLGRLHSSSDSALPGTITIAIIDTTAVSVQRLKLIGLNSHTNVQYQSLGCQWYRRSHIPFKKNPKQIEYCRIQTITCQTGNPQLLL